jgi:hypothetical protein
MKVVLGEVSELKEASVAGGQLNLIRANIHTKTAKGARLVSYKVEVNQRVLNAQGLEISNVLSPFSLRQRLRPKTKMTSSSIKGC